MIMKPLLKFIFILFSLQLTSQTTDIENVTTFTIEVPQLETTKKIWLYLPTNYSKSEKAYPVIYMHDAQNLFDAESSYAGEWKIDEYLNGLNERESIIVGIEHGNEKRIEELTPYKNATYGGGQGKAYIEFIKNNLKPKIDSTYNTLPDASNTTIFGSSLGGLVSFYAAMKYPETFGKAGVFSPAFWINPEIFTFVRSIELPGTTKLYFLAGTDEGETMLPKMEAMIQLLKSKGLKDEQLEQRIIEGGQHNEQLWASNFGTAYQWLYD